MFVGGGLVLGVARRRGGGVLCGPILGDVKDASGASVPGAAVVVTNKSTSLTRQTVTDEAGRFNFGDLPAGIYSFKASRQGFKTFEQTPVTVNINSVTRVDVTLEIGSIGDTVTVNAEPPMLQTETAEVHQNLTGAELTNLPVPLGRNYQQVYRMLPGFAPPVNSHSIPTNPNCLDIIPAARMDPIAKKIAGFIPANNLDRERNNYFVSAPFAFDRQQVDSKVDYSVNPKFNLAGTFGVLHYRTNVPTVFGDTGVGQAIGGSSNPGQGHGNTYRLTVMGTYIFSPNFLMDAHYGWARQGTASEQPGLGKNVGVDVLGIPGTNGARAFESGWPTFEFEDFATVGVNENFMPLLHVPLHARTRDGNDVSRADVELRAGPGTPRSGVIR